MDKLSIRYYKKAALEIVDKLKDSTEDVWFTMGNSKVTYYKFNKVLKFTGGPITFNVVQITYIEEKYLRLSYELLSFASPRDLINTNFNPDKTDLRFIEVKRHYDLFMQNKAPG